MSNWKPGTETPPVDWDYPYDDYVSERVVVDWEWENPTSGESFREELRFARYYWSGKRWMIEGITGNVTILRWINPKEVI